MAKSVIFKQYIEEIELYPIDSNKTLGLILQHEEVGPALPKTSFIDIPGADGSKDMTEALGVGVKFKNRTIKWVFALYPGDDWATKRTEVMNALSGKRFYIITADDPDFYYTGRVSVEDLKSDKLLKQITVTAECCPYKAEQRETVVERTDLSTSYKQLSLECGRKPISPTIVVDQETTLYFKGNTYTVSEGEHIIPQIQLHEGANTLRAKILEGSEGYILVRFRVEEL